jgi:hypothetical protein
MLNLFREESHFSQNIEIQAALSTPLQFCLRRTAEFRAPVLPTRLSLSWYLVVHAGSEFGNPFFKDPKQHDGIAFSTLVVHALKLAKSDWI